MKPSTNRIKLWDLPTRLFHCLLALAVIGAIISGQVGGSWIEWHGKLGVFIAGLLAFRLVWGFVGASYARFAQFFPTPATIKQYFQGRWHGHGHNPLGALSVFAMLGLLSLQVATGLISNDDIAFVGPLADLVSRDVSSAVTGWHALMGKGVIALVVLHIGAIAFYGYVKKERLIQPMVTGWKAIEDDLANNQPTASQHTQGGGWLALLLALLVAVGVIYAASGAWLPKPLPAAPVQQNTPSW